METRNYFAHSKPGTANKNEWQRLSVHLVGVGRYSREFAGVFGAGEWGFIAGLWHDLGKFSDAFQEYLKKSTKADAHESELVKRIDHSTAGAIWAAEKIMILGHLVGYAIAGHHSGLLDGRAVGACQENRLNKSLEPWRHGVESLPRFRSTPPPSIVANALALRGTDKKKAAFKLALFTRMIFSCLVDADSLDTEKFVAPAQNAERFIWPRETLGVLENSLERFIDNFGKSDDQVSRARALVRRECMRRSNDAPGLFSLTVPTGGGKTLSSLAFALAHARKNGLKRVIYIAPFTSIIEQNADVFRRALSEAATELGEDPVLEHHSNMANKENSVASLLAMENWDSPIVVTTAVQFYESLFAAKRGKCRKLHRLTKAVIILDEAQTIPVDYLQPCLETIESLYQDFGSTVLLCTATQPAIKFSKEFKIGLREIQEIIPDPISLYSDLRRVETRIIGTQSDMELIPRLQSERQVLCIVNTRKHAKKLYESLKEEPGTFHLSALMCPEHRSQILRKIRKNLDQNESCRVISTQLIEAGVDIDFPVVFRSMTGLDSLAQAAGRCNREGKMEALGILYVFSPEDCAAEKFVSDRRNSAAQVLALNPDPLQLITVDRYFQLYYWDQKTRWDSKAILDDCVLHNNHDFPFSFGFATIAKKFKLIDDDSCDVIVPFDEKGASLCKELRLPAYVPKRKLLRSLQRYVVKIPRRIWNQHIGHAIELVHERYSVLVSAEIFYHQETGLNLDPEQDFLQV